MSERKPRRNFSPEQKVALIHQVDTAISVKVGCESADINCTQYRHWKKQYQLGIKISLRNSRPQIDHKKKKLIEENQILKLTVINLSVEIIDLKKTVSY
jgi:transposase-like protein